MADEYYNQTQIRSLEAQLSELHKQRALLEQRLADLYQLESRFGDTQAKFKTQQQARRVALAGVASRASISRIAQRYHTGMTSLLDGSRYRQVIGGLNAGMDRIQQEISGTISQIESINAQIAHGRARLNQLEYQYQQARNEHLQRQQQ